MTTTCRSRTVAVFCAAVLSPLAALIVSVAAAAAGQADLQAEVRERERAFARTMAERDHQAFAAFVSEEAIFLSEKGVLRGRAAVAEGWKRYFDGPQAPFSWEPDRVEVVQSGTLAISTGPVRDARGARVGTFTSTWRREPDGVWRVVLDSGCPPCR